MSNPTLALASQVYVDESMATWYQDVISLLPAEDVVVGLMGFTPIHEMALIKLNDGELDMVKSIKLKPGERIFRYASMATLAGGMKPLIKVNIYTGRAYSLTDDAIEHDHVDFESRGQKLAFLRILKNECTPQA